MLRKSTVISLLVLVLCLLIGIITIPITIRSVIRDRDQIVGALVNSSEILTLPSSQYPEILLDFKSVPGRFDYVLEQSPDDNTYIKIESYLNNKYTILKGDDTYEDRPVTRITAATEDTFFNKKTPYLLSRGFLTGSSSYIIVRIPKDVYLYTTESPDRFYRNTVRYSNVEFANSGDYEAAAQPHPRDMPVYNYETDNDSNASLWDLYISQRLSLENDIASTAERYRALAGVDNSQLSNVYSDIKDIHLSNMQAMLTRDEALEGRDSDTLYMLESRLSEYLNARMESAKTALLYSMGDNNYTIEECQKQYNNAYLAQLSFERLFIEYANGHQAAFAQAKAIEQADGTTEYEASSEAIPEGLENEEDASADTAEESALAPESPSNPAFIAEGEAEAPTPEGEHDGYKAGETPAASQSSQA